ncbi:Swi3-domain-containing protein [Rickenella mellea]|uniref:Chromosome segregation in meiosis protein n=1 Tax=Rickenella mellea TaxID=50990 RepID=A0A4Y7QAZ1_9AGAM|nr:Swi3-domain-containing protein [Rickenella mellea]
MSTALDDIWSDPIVETRRSRSPSSGSRVSEQEESPRPAKRARSALFLDDPDDEAPATAPPKTPTRPDIDSLFENLDDEDMQDVPAFDLDAYRREADRRAALATPSTPITPYAVQSSSPPRNGAELPNQTGKGGKKGKGEKKERAKLDEARLLEPHGLPALVKQCKSFEPKGKGHEVSDLNKLFAIYQHWAHRMYPVVTFSDIVNRVEKHCRSRRMQVALGVWKDEINGTVNGVQKDPDDELDNTSDREDNESNGRSSSPTRRSASPSRLNESRGIDVPRPTTRPTGSTLETHPIDDDLFDIDTLLQQEEELSAVPLPPPRSELSSDRSGSMLDEDESMWAELHEGDSMRSDQPPQLASSNNSSVVSSTTVDEDMPWDILDELDKRGAPAPPQSMVNGTTGLVETMDGSVGMGEKASLVTKAVPPEDDWDEMANMPHR